VLKPRTWVSALSGLELGPPAPAVRLLEDWSFVVAIAIYSSEMKSRIRTGQTANKEEKMKGWRKVGMILAPCV
jgi:hypothetical protein